MTRVAAIDCGTNSIRLLVADGETMGEHITLNDLTRQMRIVRLGQGVDRTGRLAPEAIERTLAAVREYKRMIDNLGATDIRFVSTSAMRDAENRQDFIEPVKELLGVYPEVVHRCCKQRARLRSREGAGRRYRRRFNGNGRRYAR